MASENWDPLLRLPENLTAVVNAAFRRMVDDVVARARENVSLGRPGLIPRTGRLRESIRKGPYKQYTPGGYGEQRVYSNLIYSRVHEYGATIVPKRGPYLVFRLWQFSDTTEPTGPWVRARRVEIPARPYLMPAARDAARNWPQYVREAMRYIRGQLR
jgi:phage gpG-like protein